MSHETNRVWLHSAGASVVAVLLCVVGYAFNHTALSEGIFLLTPFCTGLAIAFMSKGRQVTLITLTTSMLLSLSILLFTGLEGLGCVAMAFPILFLSIGFGALIGYLLGRIFIHKYGNISIFIFCLGTISLVGMTNGKPAQPQALTVTTRMDFHAPMIDVWNAVKGPTLIDGDDSALRAIGLPVPLRCFFADDGQRICYFESGEMIQKVTREEYGKTYRIEIVECTFEVRDWLTFENARYDFIQKEGYVQVTRTDVIASTLRPRWYWHWFEEKCIQLEHEYVMSSMKRRAKQ